jgi:hypothetical protein
VKSKEEAIAWVKRCPAPEREEDAMDLSATSLCSAEAPGRPPEPADRALLSGESWASRAPRDRFAPELEQPSGASVRSAPETLIH